MTWRLERVLTVRIGVYSILAVLFGYGLQWLWRPTVQEVELQATQAWNAGDIETAEQRARQALGRSSDASRAREILTQLAVSLDRPALHMALTETAGGGDSSTSSLVAVGDVALSYHLLRLAEEYWTAALREGSLSQKDQAHRQLTVAAGIRLDADAMQQRLLDWSELSTPSLRLVFLYLGAASVDARDAAAGLEALQFCLAADAQDLQSRYAIARSLILLGRYNECADILKGLYDDQKANVLRAMAFATEGDFQQAASVLPDPFPDQFAPEGWYTRGLIATGQQRWQEAAVSFETAVQLRPLSRMFRSRLCDSLRRIGNSRAEEAQVRQLKTIQSIVDSAGDPTIASNPERLNQLKENCRFVGADQAVRLIEAAALQDPHGFGDRSAMHKQ